MTDDGSGVPHVATTADTRSRALSAWRRLNRSPWIEAWLIDAADWFESAKYPESAARAQNLFAAVRARREGMDRGR